MDYWQLRFTIGIIIVLITYLTFWKVIFLCYSLYYFFALRSDIHEMYSIKLVGDIWNVSSCGKPFFKSKDKQLAQAEYRELLDWAHSRIWVDCISCAKDNVLIKKYKIHKFLFTV